MAVPTAKMPTPSAARPIRSSVCTMKFGIKILDRFIINPIAQACTKGLFRTVFKIKPALGVADPNSDRTMMFTILIRGIKTAIDMAIRATASPPTNNSAAAKAINAFQRVAV